MKHPVLAWTVIAALSLPAQEQQPTFRSTTQLVEFTFVALDKGGKPVTDLKQDEIVLEDRGKQRSIAFFRFEGAPASTTAAKPLPAGAFSNRVETTGTQLRNITAIVLDTLNTAPTEATWARAQALRFLRNEASESRIAIYILGSKIGVVHDFTDDMGSLRARLDKATLGLPPLTEVDMNSAVAEAEALLRMSGDKPYMEQMLREQIESDMLASEASRRQRLEMTIDRLDSLGRHLSGIPGRKNLIWIGGGVSMLSITGAMGFGTRGNVTSYEDQVRECARRLARQGVTLYSVDARGLASNAAYSSSNSATTIPGGRRPFARQQQADNISSDPIPSAIALSSVTGGRVIQNTNDPMEAARRAANDMKGSYSVGFYLPDESDGKWRNIKIKTKRSGVQILHPEGYLAQPVAEKPLDWTKEEWTSAFQNPLGSSSIRLDGSCRPAPGVPGNMAVEVAVESSDLHFKHNPDALAAYLEMGLGDKGPTGLLGYQRISGSVKLPPDTAKLPPADENRLEREWKPRDGATALRVIVRDKLTGRFGAIDMPLNQCVAK